MSIFDEVNTWEKTKGASIFSSILQPYYQQKGGVTFDSLERGKLMVFEKK